jgi:pyroglutamyl-peptidase
MTILITGFGPFDGGSNASQRLIERLQNERAGIETLAGHAIETMILPVDSELAPRMLFEAMESLAPRLVLLCGQAAGRNRISLEVQAVNRRRFRVPDAAGRMLDDIIAPDGPDVVAATWPDPEGCIEALQSAGIPTAVSRDAGGHLCNQILYQALIFEQRRGGSTGIAFFHIPLLPEQVIAGEPASLRHPACPFMPLDMTARAIAITLAMAARSVPYAPA